MSVIKFLRDITGLFNWSTDENPTSQQDYQNAVKNWVATETSIVDALLWQPETVYAVGNQVKTPSLPSESVLVCTVAGTSGASEPDYTNVSVGDTVTDGTVEWKVSAVFTSNGGTMTGTLEVSNTVNSVSGYLGASGWGTFILTDSKVTDETGARLSLNTRHSNSVNNGEALGEFNLGAINGTNSAILNGKPDGTLTWNGWSIPAGFLGSTTGTGANTFTLPKAGTYLILTAHNSTPGVNSIFMVSLGSGAFKMGGGSNITMTTSDRNITVTSQNGSARVYYIILNTTLNQ